GENVLVPPPDNAFAVKAPLEKDPFAGGASLTPRALKESAPEDDLARHSAFFATLEPAFFNPDTEVQFLGEALLFGLLAGLLLNLMPCVLPVVSLKFSALLAVSSMTDKQQQAKAFRAHCVIFAMGIMAWFMVLALLLGVAGWAWGELFQRPIVIVLLGLMLFVLALSLFGVYSLPIFDLRISKDSHHPHWQAFASGLLATLLATPCSGPLLGGVLAWAIRQPLPVLFLCVISVGLGMSLPYYILAFWPRLAHLLPRPGTWTLRLEQLLGFFLVGSVVYLATLLPGEWLPAFLFSLFCMAFAAWLWGQIGHLRASRTRRFIARASALCVLLLAGVFGAASINADRSWEAFDPQSFTQLLGKEPMLLDFTADWCPSCKALEHTTLSKRRMEDLRRKYNVRTIRVDITRNAEAGKELLRALDSTSIPILALFPTGEGAKQPVVLRDLVTPSQLEEAASATFAGKGMERFRRMLSDNNTLNLGPSFLYEGPSCPIFPSPLLH
ncbi:thioredoxin family protein, partial [Desulfovibrio sp. OttesenSCG-928-M16]|nr:thioredoxin family protein [Desulfovibrio sp. OttesenSCG-928-M16]